MDPFCPLHSGKTFLQVGRGHSVPTATACGPDPQAREGPAPAAVTARRMHGAPGGPTVAPRARGALAPPPRRPQISLTDERQQSVVDFSALLAVGFQMLTLTLSAEHPQARGPSPRPPLSGAWLALQAGQAGTRAGGGRASRPLPSPCPSLSLHTAAVSTLQPAASCQRPLWDRRQTPSPCAGPAGTLHAAARRQLEGAAGGAGGVK